jgi:hypothetical protein
MQIQQVIFLVKIRIWQLQEIFFCYEDNWGIIVNLQLNANMLINTSDIRTFEVWSSGTLDCVFLIVNAFKTS